MLTGIVFDALDIAALRRFWQQALQDRTDGLRLRFEATHQPKTTKNRLHLCLSGGPDCPREVARLLALGARHVDIGQGEVPWDVLADPEGNEFCVLRPGISARRDDAGLENVCLDNALADRDRQSTFWRAASGWEHVTTYEWGFRLARTAASPVSLLMGPPVAEKVERNRVRLEISASDREPGEQTDPAGNEFHVVAGNGSKL